MARLLLRELEAEPAREQDADQLAYRDVLFLGAADQLGVHSRRDADQPFLHLGHLRKDSTGDMLCQQVNRGGRATNTPPPASETELPMQAKANALRVRTYEQIIAAEQDPALRNVQFRDDDELRSIAAEYAEKAPEFEGETGELMERIGKAAEAELVRRNASASTQGSEAL